MASDDVFYCHACGHHKSWTCASPVRSPSGAVSCLSCVARLGAKKAISEAKRLSAGRKSQRAYLTGQFKPPA